MEKENNIKSDDKKKEFNCPSCAKIIVKDIGQYLKDYPRENYMQCCYCGKHIPRGRIKMIVGDKE